jgi:hypothetical protein
MRPNRPLALLLAPLLAVAACDLAATPGPAPQEGRTAPLGGSFEVTSQFEVPATVAAPGPLGDVLRLVHGLATDPAPALLDLAEDAGVPALAELRFVLPDLLEAELTGWLNGYLTSATVGGASPQAQLAELDALVRSVLLSFELRSRLELSGGGEGTHAPFALAFASPAGPVVVPLGLTAPVTTATGVTAELAWPGGGAAVVTISDHAMGLPFGRAALQGLGVVLHARYGTPDLEAVLAGMVGCQALAAEVAGRCAGPLCVGHQAELLDVCLGGVSEAADQLEARLLSLDFKAIHFQAGTASPQGALVPGGVDVTSLEAGVWTAAIDLGNGAEAATATFRAVR